MYPLVFMQTIGFFLLTNIAASAHLIEQTYASFSIGCLFWLLVFFTNFQHVSKNLAEKSERPQPTFFLFIAPPAQAAIAIVVLTASEAATDNSELLKLSDGVPWTRFAEAFLYVDMFLYLLMFRLLPTFWNVDFSFAWWAYVFPLSAAACVAILKYNQEQSFFWGSVGSVLGVIACISMIVVLCFTIWALGSGKAPRNKSCLSAYKMYYAGDKPMDDLDAMEAEKRIGDDESEKDDSIEEFD